MEADQTARGVRALPPFRLVGGRGCSGPPSCIETREAGDGRADRARHRKSGLWLSYLPPRSTRPAARWTGWCRHNTVVRATARRDNAPLRGPGNLPPLREQLHGVHLAPRLKRKHSSPSAISFEMAEGEKGTLDLLIRPSLA